jgi:hypothetical protein
MLRLYRHFDAQFRGEDANGNVTPDKPSRNLKLVCSCCQHKVHAKIGALALENDFLEGALTKAGLLSARR